MTDQRRGGSARGDEGPGYRGSLPPRYDSLARPWVLIVLGIFVLMLGGGLIVAAGLGGLLVPAMREAR
jgi:hypothetical protein